MRTRHYISLSSLWAATLMLMLSVMVIHHHHLSEICVAMEHCAIDGNVNDSHTGHHDNDDEGCIVKQMHHCQTNGKQISSLRHSLTPCIPASCLFAEISSPYYIYRDSHPVTAEDIPLPDGFSVTRPLRGPPSL